jgi:hypothetical protein
MKAFDFRTRIGPDGTVPIPTDMRDELGPDQQVRVLLLVAESAEDADWARLTTEQFLQGYDAKDAIYDDVSAR